MTKLYKIADSPIPGEIRYEEATIEDIGQWVEEHFWPEETQRRETVDELTRDTQELGGYDDIQTQLKTRGYYVRPDKEAEFSVDSDMNC